MSDPINAMPPTHAELQRNREPVPSLAPYAIDLTKPVDLSAEGSPQLVQSEHSQDDTARKAALWDAFMSRATVMISEDGELVVFATIEEADDWERLRALTNEERKALRGESSFCAIREPDRIEAIFAGSVNDERMCVCMDPNCKAPTEGASYG